MATDSVAADLSRSLSPVLLSSVLCPLSSHHHRQPHHHRLGRISKINAASWMLRIPSCQRFESSLYQKTRDDEGIGA